MTYIHLPIAPSRITPDGEILNSRVRIGTEIGRGRNGIAHTGVLNGERVCLKTYRPNLVDLIRSNPAKNELHRLLRARKELPEIADSLQAPIGWYRDSLAGPVLVTRLVRDHNGAPSNNLENTPRISPSYYGLLESVFGTLSEKKILYNPVPANILVQCTSATESRPVLIDLTNYESYAHYSAKRIAHLFSIATKEIHISTWLKATLASAKEKVSGSSHVSYETLKFPPRDSRN